jgi:hypothetical protein
VLESLCGSLDDYLIESTGASLLVQFTSNGFREFKGFNGSYEFIEDKRE